MARVKLPLTDVERKPQRLRQMLLLVFAVRNKLVKRRVEEPYGIRLSVHCPEYAHEVALLEGKQFFERAFPRLSVLRHNHLLYGETPLVGIEKHVLGSAKPYALGAKSDGVFRVIRRVDVRPYLETPYLVGPCHEGLIGLRKLRLYERQRGFKYFSGGAVNGYLVAFFYHGLADCYGLFVIINGQVFAPDYAALPPPSRHDRRVRGLSSPCRKYALCRVHSSDVLGA